MPAQVTPTTASIMDFDPQDNCYFGNPYQLKHEQYGLELRDRNRSGHRRCRADGNSRLQLSPLILQIL